MKKADIAICLSGPFLPMIKIPHLSIIINYRLTADAFPTYISLDSKQLINYIMRKKVLLLVLTSIIMTISFTAKAQQPQNSADALPPGFNRAYFDETASADEIIRRNPDAMKFNDNGVLMINGKEVHQMVVNGKVVYSDNDTITDPARLLKEIHRRVIENNTPVEPVIAHIDESEILPDSLIYVYLMPDEYVEETIRKLPGVEIDKSGNITVNGKKITHVLVDGPGATNIGITDFAEYRDLNIVLQEMFNKENQYENSKKYQRQAKRASRKAAKSKQ